LAVPEDKQQNLPAEIADSLAPRLRHALGNITRRRTLRALNATADAQTLADLFDLVPAANISTLSYHLHVLENDGCVAEVSELVQVDGIVRAYVSNVTDDLAVMVALHATQQDDDRSLAGPSPPSCG
jgi:DNA-binding transcriptional ArsR family regulator